MTSWIRRLLILTLGWGLVGQASELPALRATDAELGIAVFSHRGAAQTAQRGEVFANGELRLLRVTEDSAELASTSQPERRWIVYLDGRASLAITALPPASPPVQSLRIQTVKPVAGATQPEKGP